MNIYTWTVLLGVILIILLPLLSKRKRTKEEIRKVIINLAVLMGLVAMILFFNVNPLFVAIIGVILFILVDKKTYTKKRLLIYTLIIVGIGIAGFVIFRDNPDYIVKHLKENPQTTSFYLSENGKELITYESDVVRPLASTVKTLIAVEYAMQIDAGELDEEELLPLDDLNLYYWENTDGGAHEHWLEEMKAEDKINSNNEVRLNDVAKGMIKYSSNANTDYLIALLGASNIDQRAESLGLTQHEKIYPLVGSLYISKYLENDFEGEKELISYIEDLSMQDYHSLAKELSREMEGGDIHLDNEEFDLSMNLQKVWSDRLIGSSADDYGKLLAIISNDELPGEASRVVRDLLGWPMEINPENQNYYKQLGSKGGSTAFILNDAIYAETINGDKLEMVLFTDDLNLIQNILLSHNLNSFEAKLLSSGDYRLEVTKELSE